MNEEVSEEEVLQARVATLVEHSLLYVDGEKFNSEEERRRIFLCYVVGTILGSQFQVGRKAGRRIAIDVVSSIFQWDFQQTAFLIDYTFDEIELEQNAVYFEAGKSAISEFESSVMWLHAVCEADADA